MPRPRDPEEFTADLQVCQRNIVFPDTVNNETRFWRNLSTQNWTPLTAVGLAILLVGFGSLLIAYVVAAVEAGVALKVFVVGALIWGPIFGAIAWGARRALRTAHQGRKRRSVNPLR